MPNIDPANTSGGIQELSNRSRRQFVHIFNNIVNKQDLLLDTKRPI